MAETKNSLWCWLWMTAMTWWLMKDSLSLYFRIQTASNGREAWRLIPDLQPDIIVSDVMMPEMDAMSCAVG